MKLNALLLADPGGAAYRAQPPPCRLRNHRRARGGLGRLTGVIHRTSATPAKVLGEYGYKSAAFGKWHNTLATDTTAMGPFTLWPTGEGIGFDCFYGFLAGEVFAGFVEHVDVQAGKVIDELERPSISTITAAAVSTRTAGSPAPSGR